MKEQHDIKTFDDLSKKYSTWIIKYYSTGFETPLYLIWYTDTGENSTDRILTYKSGKIFAVKSLTNLKTTILDSYENLVVSENLSHWVDNFNNLEIIENCTYDLVSIESSITRGNFDIPTIESLANFINLYGDFIEQDERNSELKVYADSELIKEVWNYFYEFIFWPRFNDKVKFEAWERPPLVIDIKELLAKLNDIIRTFDANIKPTDNAIC